MLFEKKLLGITALFLFAVSFYSTPTINVNDDLATIRLQLVSDGILGTISGLKTSIEFDPEQLEKSFVKATLEVKTLSTRNKVRDYKLGSRKYLYKKKYPTISFKSTYIRDVYDGYLIVGDLTIKDQTKQVAFDVAYREGKIVGAGSINLLDFNIKMSDKRFENKLDVYIDLPVSGMAD